MTAWIWPFFFLVVGLAAGIELLKAKKGMKRSIWFGTVSKDNATAFTLAFVGQLTLVVITPLLVWESLKMAIEQ